jgi:hypothetical protein
LQLFPASLQLSGSAVQLFPATIQNDPRIAQRFIRATTLSGSSLQLFPATIQLSRLSTALFPAYLKLADNPHDKRRERPSPQVIPARHPGHIDATIESAAKNRHHVKSCFRPEPDTRCPRIAAAKWTLVLR